jgi:hypothetical protein
VDLLGRPLSPELGQEFQGIGVNRLLPGGLGPGDVEGLELGVEVEPGLADLGVMKAYWYSFGATRPGAAVTLGESPKTTLWVFIPIDRCCSSLRTIESSPGRLADLAGDSLRDAPGPDSAVDLDLPEDRVEENQRAKSPTTAETQAIATQPRALGRFRSLVSPRDGGASFAGVRVLMKAPSRRIDSTRVRPPYADRASGNRKVRQATSTRANPPASSGGRSRVAGLRIRASSREVGHQARGESTIRRWGLTKSAQMAWRRRAKEGGDGGSTSRRHW